MEVAFMFLLIGAICAIGIYAGRNLTSAAQWANDGKTLNWVTVGILLVTFQIGGTSTIGATQNGYNLGIAGIWYAVTGTAGMIVSAFFISSLRKYITEDNIANFMENRYDKKVSNLYSYAYLAMGFVYIPIQLFTLSTIFQTIMPNLSLTAACIIGLILSMSYTVVSGVKGANYVSKISCILMYALLAVGLGLVLGKTGGIPQLKINLPSSYFTPFAMDTKIWLGWFVTVVVGFITMQAAIQPSLIAKDDSSARKGIVFGALLNLPCGFICAILGMVAMSMSLDLKGVSSMAFATVINTYCPPMLTSALFASIGLIIICTLAGQMLAIGTIFRQLLQKAFSKKEFSDMKALNITRVLTFVYGLFTIIPTFAIQRSILNQLLTILIACVTGPMFFSILSGMYWKRMNATAALWSIISGMAIGIIWVVFGMSDALHPIYIILPVSSIVGFVVCKMTSKGDFQWLDV